MKIRDGLKIEKYENAVVYPPLSAEYGGVYYKGEYIANTHGSVWQCEETVKKYVEEDRIKYISEDVIYLGCIQNHYGHFLVDTMTRLWAAIEHDGKFVICTKVKYEDLPEFVRLVFDALNITPENTFFLMDDIVRYKIVYVPDLSFLYNEYVSEQFKKTFDAVIDFVGPVVRPNLPQKIFLSRSKFVRGGGTRLGRVYST